MAVFSLGFLLTVLAAPTTADDDRSARREPIGALISVASAEQAPESRLICIQGQLTDEGIECPALRSEGGLYTLAGDTGGFEIGDEVCVCGAVADVSFCMQGTTITVTHISPGKGGCPP
jgi:hypothetical protein